MRRLGWQVPLVVVLGMLAWWALGPTVAAVPALYIAAVAPELARIDLAEHRLPNRLVVPGLVVGLVAATGSWAATGAPPVIPLVAGLAYGGALLLFALAGGMGMGDVKLAAVLGLASPTAAVAIASPVLAFLSGGVAALVVLIVRGRGARIPFGPFLVLGYAAALALEGLAGGRGTPV